jgi:group I intron endonuclease
MQRMIRKFLLCSRFNLGLSNIGLFMGAASFFTLADGDSNNLNPVVIYENVEIQKDQILQENKGKCGVYRLTNIANKKTYVGSARNLRTRFYVYYSASRLASSNMIIYKAILKYGYSNFILEILEYCEPDNVVGREQYYLDLLKPEYNILSTAGSSFGYKHTKEALEKMSVGRSAYTGYKLSAETRGKLAVAATGRVLSEETKAKISAARMGIKLSDETRAKLSAATFNSTSRVTFKLRGMSYSYPSSQLGSMVKYYYISSRYFSSFFRLLDDNRNINIIDNKSIVKYDNADIDKVKILKENKGKSGVYL